MPFFKGVANLSDTSNCEKIGRVDNEINKQLIKKGKTMKVTQDNWTSSVSQYLLTRRKQTNKAYLNQANQQANANGSNLSFNELLVDRQFGQLFQSYEDCLFEVVLSAVGLELEQGNTVINLLAEGGDDGNGKGKIEKVNLEHWQRQLLLIFLSECISLLDMSIDALLDQLVEQTKQTLTQFNQLTSFSSLDTETQAYIVQQMSVVKRLVDFYQRFNQLCIELDSTSSDTSYCLEKDSSKNDSLRRFFEGLSELAFFVKQQLITNTENNAYDLQSSNLQTNNQHAPLVLNYHNNRLTIWLHRNWQAEQSVLRNIYRLNGQQLAPFNLSAIVENSQTTLNAEQISAIEMANNNAFSIITGGPGTGKTYTIAQLVIAIHHANANNNINKKATTNTETPLSLVLSAPTGKAAQRMQESLQSALEDSGVRVNLQEAKTIHRLLGIGQSGLPRYGQQMPLAEDVIIVDEASMLGVELADHLLSAVKTGARLILLGDAHQLSAVEAGAVLSDLCRLEMTKHCHANLIESRRFTDASAVGQLAKFINQPPVANSSGLPELTPIQPSPKGEKLAEDNSPSKISLLNKLHALIDDYADLNFYPVADVMSAKTATVKSTSKATIYQKLIDCYEKYFQQTATLFNVSASLSSEQGLLSADTTTAMSDLSKLNELMAIFNEFQILTTGHNGDYGDEQINQVLTQAHRQFLKLPISPLRSQSQSQLTSQLQWFHGRPVMVRKNNYGLGLFNGDIGLCVQTKKGLAVFFEGKQQPIAVNSLGNLQVSTAYAMTVHKSQGSEFTHVAIMLDERSPRLLSREMLYTAVTRAKKQVSLFASDESIYTAISSPTIRQTGLG